jgi:hypothetical protein
MANTSGGSGGSSGGTRGGDVRTGTTGSTGTTGGAMGGAQHTGGTGVAEKARDVASGAVDRAKDVASNVADKARDVASNVADTAKDWASTAGNKAESALEGVGSGMTSLAGTVREKLPHEGMMGTASDYVADALESGGRYLQQEGFSGMADDLTNLIRRNPIPALLVGIGLGYLLARSTSRS